MFGSNSTLFEFNSFLRSHGFRLQRLSQGSYLLQEAAVRHKGKNYGGWVDKKVFYDFEDVILFANHKKTGTDRLLLSENLSSSSKKEYIPRKFFL